MYTNTPVIAGWFGESSCTESSIANVNQRLYRSLHPIMSKIRCSMQRMFRRNTYSVEVNEGPNVVLELSKLKILHPTSTWRSQSLKRKGMWHYIVVWWVAMLSLPRVQAARHHSRWLDMHIHLLELLLAAPEWPFVPDTRVFLGDQCSLQLTTNGIRELDSKQSVKPYIVQP